jgi:hypothetical protein
MLIILLAMVTLRLSKPSVLRLNDATTRMSRGMSAAIMITWMCVRDGGIGVPALFAPKHLRLHNSRTRPSGHHRIPWKPRHEPPLAAFRFNDSALSNVISPDRMSDFRRCCTRHAPTQSHVKSNGANPAPNLAAYQCSTLGRKARSKRDYGACRRGGLQRIRASHLQLFRLRITQA